MQGVFFRASSKEQADKLGIIGWVKNTPNGEVHMYAEGDEVAMQEFINWCHKGPIYANVNELIAEETYMEENISGFEILR